MNPHREHIRLFETALRVRLIAPPAGTARPPKPKTDAPVALLFSPHPDDEVITGALPLRLQHEAGARVVNVAVTLGSNPTRRAARRRELSAACALLGWQLEILGWKGVTPSYANRHPVSWKKRVEQVATLIRRWQPRWIFYPHAGDWHPAHHGVNLLVEAALRKVAFGAKSSPWRIQTEYWHPLAEPNLLVECPAAQLARLVAALCCHRGEIARNPYHLTLPAWMMDSVRRGAERVGGHGTPSPKFPFGTLYRIEPKRPPDWPAVVTAKLRLRA